MKEPDYDRYELWLRDHLSRTLGATAAADVNWRSLLDERTICHVRVLPAKRPVFLTRPRGRRSRCGSAWAARPASSAWTRRDELRGRSVGASPAAVTCYLPVNSSRAALQEAAHAFGGVLGTMIWPSTSLRCSRA